MPQDQTLALTQPAEIADLDARSAKFRTPCGEGSMVWRVWGEGSPVVLLHGGFGAWSHWVRNIDFLAKHHRVFAPDMPGKGESASPPQPYDGASIGGIIAEGIRQLIPPPTKVQVVGFSFGALVSGFVTAALGDQARSLTLVSPSALGAPRGTNLAPLEEWRGLPPAEMLAIHRKNLANIMFSDESKVDDTALYIQATNVPLGRIKVIPLVRKPYLREILSTLKVPLDGVWGELDTAAYPFIKERQAIVRELCPDATIETVAGCGHWIAYEAADRFNPILLRLLAKRGG